jgi:metal-dependent hydrolase (beta-lactamase superfamily II)
MTKFSKSLERITGMAFNELDRVEILSLQDNYIEITAMDDTGVGKVHAVMGGFHLSRPAFDAVIGPTAEELRKIGPDFVIPCHCTGRKAIMQVEQAMPGQFILNMSGTTLTFRA